MQNEVFELARIFSLVFLSSNERGLSRMFSLAACRTCEYLQLLAASFNDLWAACKQACLGVCKVKNAQNQGFFAFFSIGMD